MQAQTLGKRLPNDWAQPFGILVFAVWVSVWWAFGAMFADDVVHVAFMQSLFSQKGIEEE